MKKLVIMVLMLSMIATGCATNVVEGPEEPVVEEPVEEQGGTEEPVEEITDEVEEPADLDIINIEDKEHTVEEFENGYTVNYTEISEEDLEKYKFDLSELGYTDWYLETEENITHEYAVVNDTQVRLSYDSEGSLEVKVVQGIKSSEFTIVDKGNNIFEYVIAPVKGRVISTGMPYRVEKLEGEDWVFMNTEQPFTMQIIIVDHTEPFTQEIDLNEYGGGIYKITKHITDEYGEEIKLEDLIIVI